MSSGWWSRRRFTEFLETARMNDPGMKITPRRNATAASTAPPTARTVTEPWRDQDDLVPWMGESSASAWPDGWILLDTARRIVGYNLRFFELWGLSEEEIGGLRGANPERRHSLLMNCTLARVRDPETVAAGIRRQLGLPEEVTFDDVLLKDGRILERYGVPLRDDRGRLIGRAISLRDVTARRRVEVELRERARQQEAIADLGKASLRISDVETLLQEALRIVALALGADVTHFLEFSERGTKLTLRAGSVLGVADPERIEPARSPAGLAAAQNSTVVVADLANEVRFLPDGHARNYGASVSVVVRGRIRPFGVLCSHWRHPRGMTEDEVHFLETAADLLSGALARMEAETQILERERGIRAVFDASLDGLLTFEDDGNVTEANPAAARIFDRALDEILGHPIFSLFGEGAREQCQSNFRALVTTGRCSGEQELRFAGRPPRVVEYAAVAAILPDRHLVVLRDVTESRQMHARLALTDRMASLGTLAAGLAHELNNPLAYVTANLAYVADAVRDVMAGPTRAGANLPQDLIQAVMEAREGAGKMRSIIQDLRTFSRGEGERNVSVDLRPVLDSCVNMAWNEMKHRARFERKLEDVPFVRGNEARLGQVFLNLLVNAAQAIPEGHANDNVIRLATRRLDDGRVSVEVTDTGSGVSPEVQRHIFDPFFTTKSIGVGTGLGLSICHSIVTGLGGSIEVDSVVGKGTTFRVVLLCAPEPAIQGSEV
jgi:PAS domain S-box-containing protein